MEDRVLLSPGDLDVAFGDLGTKVIQFPGVTNGSAKDMVIDPDGNIVLAGSNFLARLRADGSPDPSFGTGGIVVPTFGSGEMAIALQTDGKIVTVGGEIVHRYLANGAPDLGFGPDGTGTTTIDVNDSFEGWAHDVTIQPDGKIVVVGSIRAQIGPTDKDFLVVRLTEAGQRDPAFNQTGIAWFDLSVNPLERADDTATCVATQEVGGEVKILVGGYTEPNPGSDADMAILRLNANGKLDNGFGTHTLAVFSDNYESTREIATDIVVQANGRVVLGGYNEPNFGVAPYAPERQGNLVLACYGLNGHLDTSFGNFTTRPGVAIATRFSLDHHLNSIATQTNRKIVVASSDNRGRFLLARFTAEGDLDASFGQAGWVTTDFAQQAHEEGVAVALQTDGKIVLAGGGDSTYVDPTYTDVARYLGDPQPFIAVTDAQVVEGDSGTRNLTFQILLSAATDVSVRIRYATADGTANSASDYDAMSGDFTFQAGETNKYVSVPVRGDVNIEQDETCFLRLSGAVNGLLADAEGMGTILNDETQISIGEIIRAEGQSGETTFLFPVSLSGLAPGTVTVLYVTADGTAVVGQDYIATSGSLTFRVGGPTMFTLPIKVRGDTVSEPDEFFYVRLSAATNATIADGEGVGTILNDDSAITIADATIAEGNAGQSALTFQVTLSGPAVAPVSVQYETADGTARAGQDYTPTSGILTFRVGGPATLPITVMVRGDTTVEPSESFFVRLKAPIDAIIADGEAVGTILNDDATLRISDVRAAEGQRGVTNFNFTVSLQAASTRPVSVRYATANGTALAGSDYRAASGTLRFVPGETTKTVTVAVRTDSVPEPDEKFFVRLSTPMSAIIADGEGVGTILNDDTTIRVADVAMAEGQRGTTPFQFRVTLSAAATFPVTVRYTTVTGTAVSGSDYVATSGTLTFARGQTTRTITVPVVGDTMLEPDERFLVRLSVPTNATIADGEAVGTIRNDDIGLTINDVRKVEGNRGTTAFTFEVKLSTASPLPVTVRYATANGTARAGSDYTAASGTLTFAPRSVSRKFTVLVQGDTRSEPNETFYVRLSAPRNAVIADAEGIGTIVNDDAVVPSISYVVSGRTLRVKALPKGIRWTATPWARCV